MGISLVAIAVGAVVGLLLLGVFLAVIFNNGSNK